MYLDWSNLVEDAGIHLNLDRSWYGKIASGVNSNDLDQEIVEEIDES